ncbi:hypothetical protein ACP70R_039169 [Stipagrostis hirtigluma subsp. patula]
MSNPGRSECRPGALTGGQPPHRGLAPRISRRPACIRGGVSLQRRSAEELRLKDGGLKQRVDELSPTSTGLKTQNQAC